MSRLSDVIHEIVEEFTDAAGLLDVHRATAAAVARVGQEELMGLACEEIARRLHRASTSRAKASLRAQMQASAQGDLFPNLYRGYAVDLEGRQTRLTEFLSRIEFKRVIEIRRKQVEADQAHLRELERAYAAVALMWDRFPDETFGQICERVAAASRETGS